MSLQAILDAIYASGADQVREIEAHTQARVEEVLAAAESEAWRLREESRAAAAAPATAARARILYPARLEALQIVGKIREELVDTVLGQTEERLAGMRTEDLYAPMLRQLTEEALTELNGSPHETENTRLEADPRDRELLEGILQDLGLELQLSYELGCWGGLTARSEDGRVVVVNTLETRLERGTPHLRRCLAALFEEAAKDEECPVTTMAMRA